MTKILISASLWAVATIRSEKLVTKAQWLEEATREGESQIAKIEKTCAGRSFLECEVGSGIK